MLIHNADITGSLLVNGTRFNTGSFSGSFTGIVVGTTATASYVEYNNVANKPALVSGSSQITYSGLTGIPSGIVSGSAQVAGFGIFATTGSNQFNGSQAITGSLTVTGQVVAQTLNVQQVTSSIVYSSGSNIFGNSLSDTQQFTGSVGVTGSLTIAGAGTFSNTLTLNGSNNVIRSGNELRFNRTDNAVYTRLYDAGSLAANGFILDNINGEGFHFQNNGTTIMRMNSSGNVGIGTNSPSTLLHVSGSGTQIGRIVSTFALSSGYSDVVQILNPNQTGGGLSLNIGKAESTRNLGKIVYAHSSDGSTSNRLAFGFYDADNLLNLTAGGNVGIGTTSPVGKLDVTLLNTRRFIVTYDDSIVTIKGASDTGAGENLRIIGDNLIFNTNSVGSGTERMRITSGGNVGIGIIPSYKLDIANSVAAPSSLEPITLRLYNGSDGGSAIYFQNVVGGQSKISFGVESAGSGTDDTYLGFSTGANTALSERMRITSGGNVLIGTTTDSGSKMRVEGGELRVTTTNGGVALYRTGDTGEVAAYNWAGSAYLNLNLVGLFHTFSTSGTERMRITSGGNVGIGTTSPNSNLEVRSNNSTAYDATSDNGQDDAGATITVRNGNTTTNSFAQIDMQVSGDEGRAVGRIVTIRRGSATSDMAFVTENANTKAEKMRITSTGYVYLGNGFSATNHRINLGVNQGGGILVVSGYESSPPGSNNDTAIFYGASGASPNTAATALGVMTNSSTGRSINAGGTINASGADYAEYMTKAVEGNIAKGDIVGIDSDAKVTNIFANAVSFAVKSTDPSYVGGDVWGNAVGKRPERTTDQTEEEFAPILAEFEAELEIARAKVDRISFSGQVPCNVMGASVGDYIIPVETENGKIGGQAISNPTFEQYQIAVGKVWKIMEDGRAWIAVKIG